MTRLWCVHAGFSLFSGKTMSTGCVDEDQMVPAFVGLGSDRVIIVPDYGGSTR